MKIDTIDMSEVNFVSEQGGLPQRGVAEREAAQQTSAAGIRSFPDELPTLDQVRALLMERGPGPAFRRESVRLFKAQGRVLAEPIYAETDVPAFDRSTMDGYAVVSEAIQSADADDGVELTLVGEASAEKLPERPLRAGEAFGVATGTTIPSGADAVVPGEYCRLWGTDRVLVLRALSAGANILRRGSDLEAGQLAVDAGTVLQPSHIGTLAALGRTKVTVYARPVVSIITTGEELVPPEKQPAPGQIRDSNTYSLAAALSGDGAVVRKQGIISGRLDTLVPLLKQEQKQADIVLISGGSSVGKTDLTKEALSEIGADILFHGVKLRPGKPTMVGLKDHVVYVGLPGNPVSALTIYYVLVRPLLRQRMGWRDPLQEPTVAARLTQTIRRPKEREELVRVRLYHAEGQLWAEPVFGSSGMLHSMSLADGHVLINMSQSEIRAESMVDVRLFD